MIKKTLYFGHAAYLSLRNGQMMIKMPEVEKSKNVSEVIRRESVTTVPVEDIGIVVLDCRELTVTHALITALLENTAAVITCDSSHLPAGMMLPLRSNTVQSERFRTQIDASLPLRKQLWQQTVKAKVRNQAALLESVVKNSGKCMRVWAEAVKSGDPYNIEARAAVYYWRNIFPSIPQFIRAQDGLWPNTLLNYGYAVLRAIVARSLVVSGLLPTLGIHHHNRYDAYCLADDIMEPYRPFVDRLVIDIMKSGEASDTLDTKVKSRLLSIPVLDVVIDGKHSPLMVAVASTTASLAKCFASELRKISYPELL